MTFFDTIPGLQDFLRVSRQPLLVVLGPTASGKTDFSIQLAGTIGDVEIINADSRQLYRRLDIGTAKITKEETRGIPHHLLDVLDPREEATVAWYKERTTATIDDVVRRTKIPLLVGGSMLYLSAIIDGLEFPAGSDETVRRRLSDAYDEDGGDALYRRLQEIDPDTAAAFNRANKPYVIRALELFELRGEKPSALKKTSPSPYDLFLIGIDRPREETVNRINARTKQLFERGWIDEVRGLLTDGFRASDPGMKSHGYREIIEYIETGKPPLEELIETISAKTRQYAKRQRTWWRGDERIRWIGMD